MQLTNCLISYMLLNSLSELSNWLCLSYRTILFSLLACFLFATIRWNCHENLGLLSFRANVEKFSCAYNLTGKKFGCCLSLILKHSDISPSHNNNSVDNLNANNFQSLLR